MASTPNELSLAEIREFMLVNRGKVTNHALVKHFKKFLTHPQTQNEARKNFKVYVNILATSKTEGTEKYLLLRKRYYNECPSEDAVSAMAAISPMSPDSKSISDCDSPSRVPPPYRPPPEPTTPTTPLTPNFPTSSTVVSINGPDRSSNMHFRDCIDEFKNAITVLKHEDPPHEIVEPEVETVPNIPPRKRNSIEKPLSREPSVDLPDLTQSPRNRAPLIEDQQNIIGLLDDADTPTKISVKRATEKFNRIVSEEEEAAKISSPPGKIAKKPEKNTDDKENLNAVSLIGHPKSKEWMVSAARANYQELAKLSIEFPELTRFKDSNTGYTALHWAAKHGNEDVVKLIAGRHKANVNVQTNGGYTPLHLAMQFGRDNIFELLCNTYKADRDLLDWSGRKALDYRKQKTSVSPSTFSSEYLINQNLPVIQSNIVVQQSYGTLPSKSRRGRDNNRHQRYATTTGVVQRSYSLLTADHKPKKYDSDSNATSPQNDVDLKRFGSIRRSDKRNRSFLMKTFKSNSKKTISEIPE